MFGDFKFIYDNKEYTLDWNNTVKILYKSDIHKYYLLVSKKIELKQSNNSKYIAIDQEIKPFISCRTNNELIHFGNYTSKMIGKYLKKIDNINKLSNLSKVKKRKIEKKYNLKINNKVNETHWKIIKYITNNYKYVII